MERLIAPSDLVNQTDHTAPQLSILPTVNWEVFELAISDVYAEIDNAIFKHSFEQTPLNQDKDLRDSFVILSEEFGEVARALTYDEGDRFKLHNELIQLATMAVAMAAAVELGATSG